MDITDVPKVCNKKAVLICDDSKSTLHAMKSSLSKRYHVITASSGYEALSFAALYCPNIIVMDVMMYGMNGFETLVRLKSNVITKDIPVIFLSGLAEKKYIDKGKELGVIDYMVKPFAATRLIENIEKIIGDDDNCYEKLL